MQQNQTKPGTYIIHNATQLPTVQLVSSLLSNATPLFFKNIFKLVVSGHNITWRLEDPTQHSSVWSQKLFMQLSVSNLFILRTTWLDIVLVFVYPRTFSTSTQLKINSVVCSQKHINWSMEDVWYLLMNMNGL